METTMRKRRKRYSPEFKREALELLNTSGKSLNQVAHELGIPNQTLSQWATAAEGPAPVVKPTETVDEEVKRLRKENDRLRMERDFLKKAAAFFAKDENK
jgi:transposase